MSDPIKHHYIPEFILRRFFDDQNKLHSFNKIYNKINKRKYSPSEVCHEEHLHTLTHMGEKSFEIEAFYSKIEGEFFKLLTSVDKYIEDGNNLADLHHIEDSKKIIILFLTMQFWRIPKRNIFAKQARTKLRKIYDNAPIENKAFLTSDRKIIRDLERKNAGISEKITQFLVLPALLSNMNNSALQKCQFYLSSFDLIISDDPIICEITEDYALDGDIYFPLGKRLCITNMPEKIEYFQKKIFDNADKIVMANSNAAFSQFIDVVSNPALSIDLKICD